MNTRISKGYHVTTEASLFSILEQGIVPAIGPRSLMFGEVRAAIYLFSNDTDVEDGLVNWINDAFDEEETIYVLECRLDGINIERREGQFELISRERIDPLLITNVYTEDLKPYMAFEAGKFKRVPA